MCYIMLILSEIDCPIDFIAAETGICFYVNLFPSGNQQGLIVANELQEQKAILGKCIKQLGSVEAKRATVVAKLKEAIQEQVWFQTLPFVTI